MKNTKRYFAYLAVTALQAYGTGRILKEAIDSEDSMAILGATLISIGSFAANTYVSLKISEDMAEEVTNKIFELRDKRKQKKEKEEELGVKLERKN